MRRNRDLRHILILIVLWGIGLPASAQDDEAPGTAAPPPPVSAAFDSPASTLRTFIEAMKREVPDFDRGVECMDISTIVAEAAPDIALKLYKCLNRIELINFENDNSLLTAAQLRQDRHRGLATWTLFPRQVPGLTFTAYFQYQEVQALAPEATIALARDAGGAWRFSAETVAGVEDLHDRIGRLDPIDASLDDEYQTAAEIIEGFWPAYFIENDFLRVKYWQWASLLVLIFIGLVLDFTVRFLLAALSRRIIRRKGGEAKSETLKRTVRPFGLTAAAVLWLYAIDLLGLPSAALSILLPAVKFFAMLAVVWAAYRVTDLIGEVFLSKAESTDTKFDDLLVPLIRKTIKIFITVFGLIYIADSFEVPLAPLLTGLGIGGAGFAFAAKDTLEHFFGSLTVIADRPFQVGDWVLIDGTEGTVEEVGFRSTRVRTFYNSLVTIPNGNLVRAVVDNFGKRRYRRWRTHLNLTYSTPPESIEAFCEGIRELIRLHPYTRKDYYQVWLHEFGAHSLDVLVYMFHETPDWQTELRERHRFMLDIIRLADQLGVEFAFPTQTLHVIKEDAVGEPGPPSSPPPSEADRRARIDGRRAVRRLTANAEWRDGKPGPHVFTGEGADDEDGEDETQIESKIGGDG